MTSFPPQSGLPGKERVHEVSMTMTYGWQESYKAALLETDWSKIKERIQAAESAMNHRQLVLSQDHGGTPEERQAIADAMRGLKVLRTDVTEWQKEKSAY